MLVDSIIFWIFAALAVVGGLVAVLHRSIVYAALSLIVVFLSIAGFFMLNNADFLALAQVIVYAVGLTIILLFAIMFTGDTPIQDRAVPRASMIGYGIVVAYVLALLIRTALSPAMANAVPMAANHAEQLRQQDSTQLLGALLFQNYGLPFEVASMLLLGAMIGAIVIAKKSFADVPEGDTRFAVDLDSKPRPDALDAFNKEMHATAGAEK